jgi:hypothetical protein
MARQKWQPFWLFRQSNGRDQHTTSAVERAWATLSESKRVPWRIQCRILNGAVVNEDDRRSHKDPTQGPDLYDTGSFEDPIPSLTIPAVDDGWGPPEPQAAPDLQTWVSSPLPDWENPVLLDWVDPTPPQPEPELTNAAPPTIQSPVAAHLVESAVRSKPVRVKPAPVEPKTEQLLTGVLEHVLELVDELYTVISAARMKARDEHIDLIMESRLAKVCSTENIQLRKEVARLQKLQNSAKQGAPAEPTRRIIKFSKEDRLRLLRMRIEADDGNSDLFETDSDEYNEDGTSY